MTTTDTDLILRGSPRRSLYGLLAFALLLRLAYVLACPQLPLESEPYGYHQLAVRWAAGGGFPSWAESDYEIAKPPLYTLFLGALYAVAGPRPEVARAAQALVWMLVVWCTFLLARRVTGRDAIAWAAAALVAVLPGAVAYTGLLFTESLFTLAYVLFALSLVAALERSGVWAFARCGAVAGVVALISARAQYLPLLVAAVMLWRVRPLRRSAAAAAALTVGFLLTVAPWTVWSTRTAGRFVFLTTYQHNNSLWLAFNREGITELDYTREPLKSLAAGRPSLERQRLLQERAWQDLRRYPGDYVRNSFVRFLKLWGASHANNMPGLREATRALWVRHDWPRLGVKAAWFAVHAGLTMLGFLGMWRHRRAWPYGWVLMVPVVYLTALHSFLVTSPRFQVPMWPFIAIFAAALLAGREEAA